eukprot:gene27766-33534_t
MKRMHEEVECTIPTIGFNVETLTTRSNSFRCWDVGGCDKIRPLWRHYMLDVRLLVFMIDSNDVERLEDALKELNYMLMENDMMGKPVLLLANKQDLPRALSAGEIINKAKLHESTGRDWYVLPTTLMGTTNSVGQVRAWLDCFASDNWEGCKAVDGILYKLADGATNIEEIAERRDQSKEEISATSTTSASALQANTSNEAIVQQVADHDLQKVEAMKISWLEREDEADEVFLACILDGSAEVWDHYVHIRLAYVYISQHGVQQGFGLVAHAIKTYLDKKAGKQSFHATMTHFWCHTLGFALCSLHSDAGHVSLKDFVQALFSHEKLAAYELWSGRSFGKWFSSAVMFGAEARARVLQPDLQALPPLLDLLRQKESLLQLPTHAEDLAFLLNLQN